MYKFVIDNLVNILGINDALKFHEITLIAKLSAYMYTEYMR